VHSVLVARVLAALDWTLKITVQSFTPSTRRR
jgi:hypothetical protein